MAARVVEGEDEFRAVEHGMFELLVEGDGAVWAGVDAELAEHARTEVVLILGKYFFLLAVLCLDGFACHADGAVGAGHLAQAAGHAAVLVLLVVGHDEGAAEAVEHLQLLAVFGVLLRYLGREELTHGGLQADGQALDALEKAAEISVVIFHYC